MNYLTVSGKDPKVMKALILNGEKENVLDFLQEAIVHAISDNGWSVETVVLREKDRWCTGCFGCWTKTPGTCVIDDFGIDWPTGNPIRFDHLPHSRQHRRIFLRAKEGNRQACVLDASSFFH